MGTTYGSTENAADSGAWHEFGSCFQLKWTPNSNENEPTGQIANHPTNTKEEWETSSSDLELPCHENKLSFFPHIAENYTKIYSMVSLVLPQDAQPQASFSPLDTCPETSNTLERHAREEAVLIFITWDYKLCPNCETPLPHVWPDHMSTHTLSLSAHKPVCLSLC